MRNEDVNLALATSISRERLRKYLCAAGGDLDHAIRLYERNMLLAEAFYIPLSSLEVCLRNRVHDRMAQVYGPDWLTNAATVPLNDFSRSLVNEAVRNLPQGHSTGKLIAELKFAFWVGLMAQQYDATLWRRALHGCFRPGLKRRRVHGRMNAIRRFRNRVAHHEPIFSKNCEEMHEEIIEATGWMCAHTRHWTEHHSRVPKVLAGEESPL